MEVYRRSAELLEADIGDEVVALQPEAGLCFGFNSVAKEVWRKLESPRSFNHLKAHLVTEYDVEDARCSRELSDLLANLIGHGLVRCTLE